MRAVKGFSAVLGIAGLIAVAGAAMAGPRPVAVSPSVFVPPVVALPPAPPAAAVDPALANAQTASAQATQRIVRTIRSSQVFCASVGNSAYAIDCLSERLAATAASLPETGDYAEAREALTVASRKLNQVARNNSTRDLPRINVRQPVEGGIATSRPLVPVAPERQAEANAQAAAILDEAATVLLRSTESADDRRDDYLQIATAVGSNKVLLRSL